jgi:hypothetical protein
VSLRRALLATAFLAILTGYLTWPQGLYMSSRVANHDDAFFSMWRLGWIAHALKSDPAHLYDANIFYPEPRTLAYSDAVIFEGLLAAPLQWAGLSFIFVYNLMLLGGIVASGVGMFVLGSYLTGNEDAALVAATIFVMVPYRVDHFAHLELQWACWIPLTFWAVHRTIDRRSFGHGVLVGGLIWLQLISSVYYGIFLGLATVALVVLIGMIYGRRAVSLRAVLALAAGGAVALALAYVSMRPYLANSSTLGVRPFSQVADFSASPASYFAAPQENWWWGWTEDWFPGDELHLFPGAAALALALAGLLIRPSKTVWVYAALTALSIELSFGAHGHLFPWLREHLFVLQGLRAIARFAVVGFCTLSVVAGFGFAALQARWPARWRRVPLVAVCLLALALEYGSAPMRLEAVAPSVPEVYQLLRKLPRGPVAELPMATPKTIPGYDSMYMFSSIAHWYPLLNGYSGFVSGRYVKMLERMRGFPGPGSIEQLCELNARYVIVHENRYERNDYTRLLEEMTAVRALQPIGQYRDVYGTAALFELRCQPSTAR